MKTVTYIFPALLFLVLPGAIHAKPVEYYLKLAFDHNPYLMSEIHKTGASKRAYRAETLFPKNPVFSFAYSNIPVTQWPSKNQHPMSGISFGVSHALGGLLPEKNHVPEVPLPEGVPCRGL